MPHLEIKTDYFLGPKDAFQLVGKESFGEIWNVNFIDRPDSQEYIIALNNLRQALRSGQVAAHWATADFELYQDLRPQDADQEFFSIRLAEDKVFHQGVNDLVYCRVHSEQLRRFLIGGEPQSRSPTQLDSDRCYVWLVETFSGPEFCETYGQLRKMAKIKFRDLSDFGFKKARKSAIKATGRFDLAKPGRRKNPIGK